MTRSRVALVLAVFAVLSVLTTAAIAVATDLGDDEESMPEPLVVAERLVVTDPASGARFWVPVRQWEVRGPRSRIYYADSDGQPTTVVRGPAVFRDGYCAGSPEASNRAFAGFTRQPFAAWVGSLGQVIAESDETVTVADGSEALLQRARVQPDTSGPCAAPEAYVAMVHTDDVRVVLVADAGAPETPTDDEIEKILRSLMLRAS